MQENVLQSIQFYLNVLTYFRTVLSAFNWTSRRDYTVGHVTSDNASLGCTCC